MSNGVMTPNASLAAPGTPNLATVGLSTMQKHIVEKAILQDALAEEATAKQAMSQSEKVLLLAKAQRDTCKTRLQLVTHMVAEARRAEKQRSKATPKDRKQDTTQKQAGQKKGEGTPKNNTNKDQAQEAPPPTMVTKERWKEASETRLTMKTGEPVRLLSCKFRSI